MLHEPEFGEKYYRVDLQPEHPCIHLCAGAGPEGDLIMVNFYQNSRWLTFTEAIDLATALTRCARDATREANRKAAALLEVDPNAS